MWTWRVRFTYALLLIANGVRRSLAMVGLSLWQVLLGGEELLSNKGKYMVVSSANLFKHLHAFESLMERWDIPRGLLLGLVHSFEPSYRYPGMPVMWVPFT